MKFKNLVRIFSLVFALIIVAVPLLRCAAEAEENSADCPYISVPGFMATDIYVDPADPESELVWPPSTDRILAAVKESLPSLALFLVDRNYSRLEEDVLPAVTEMFRPAFLAPDGTPGNTSGIRWEYPAREDIKKDSSLTFRYDWRIDPVEVAAQLNDFINYVLDASGCSQVVLECHSYGGIVTTTYVKNFGCSKVRSFVMNSTATFGETYNGELMTGKITFDADSLTSYLESAFEYNEKEKLLNGIFKMLRDIGVTGNLCDFANDILAHTSDEALSKSIVPMFGGWLSIWSMIPDEKIDEAYNYIFNRIYANDSTDRSGLKEKINNYNTNVRPYKKDVLRQMDEQANLYVIARYGYSSMFMTPSWKNASDSVIDVKYASFGATCAQYGSVLENAGTVPERYLSPDKSIDASSCMFPEQTWFVKGLTHSYSNHDFDEMVKAMLYYDGQATVDTLEGYSRFMINDEENNCLVIDTGKTEGKPLTFLEKVREFFVNLIEKIKSFFSFK